MGKITEANFKPHSIKILKGGVKASVSEMTVMGKDVTSIDINNKHCKDDPHPDFTKSFEALQEIVRYDEGYGDDVDIKVTGVRLYSDDVAQITHMKEIESGSTSRNSGKISRDSEEFEKAERLFELIAKVKHECYEYFVNKKRSQLTIFNGEDEKENKDAA